MIKNLIIDAAYFLNTSKNYQIKKRFFYNILENDKYQYKKFIDILMIILIFISVTVLIREVKHPVNDSLLFFSTYVISIIFFVEYILRLWVYSSVSLIIVKQAEHDSLLERDIKLFKAFIKIVQIKFKYILSVRAIIDLLAILPFFHELRLLRIFILFRIFKLFRYTKSFQTLSSVLASKKFEFLTLAMFASIVIFVSSVLIYVMEANNPASPIDTMFEAVYWSIVTISTVGFGDITPVSVEGRVVAMIVIITGIAVLAFTTSIVVSAFTEKLDEIKEVKTIEDLSKLTNLYLVCGYKSVAKEVCKKLLNHEQNIIILDENKERAEQAKNDGFRVLNFDSGSVISYKKLNLNMKKQVKAVLCLFEDDVQNVYTALTVRSLSQDILILSLLMQDSNRKKLEYAKIDKIVYPQELMGLITRGLVGQPVAFKVINELGNENSNEKISELAISKRILENYTNIGELPNKKFRIVILGLYKKEKDRFYFNPLDNTFLENGDYLLLIGYKVFINEFENHLYLKVKNA